LFPPEYDLTPMLKPKRKDSYGLPDLSVLDVASAKRLPLALRAASPASNGGRRLDGARELGPLLFQKFERNMFGIAVRRL
jgi:hypothetical protein